MNTQPFDLQREAQSDRMSDHLVRLGRLTELMAQRGWDDAELARQTQRKPQQVHSWRAGNRHIGERLARSLEEVLRLPRYWLDERASTAPVMEVREAAVRHYAAPAVVQDAPSRQEPVPVLLWDSLSSMLIKPNTSLRAGVPRLLTLAPASRSAKFVAMPDDSMMPLVAPGDHLLFDPAEAPHAGDIVLVRIPTGEHFVRSFRPRTAQAWEGLAANPAYAPLASNSDSALIVAVMVEHRKYRVRR